KDYWVREPERFQLYILEGVDVSFAARLEAQPDPPTEVSPMVETNGMPTLQITGPIGSDQLIEVSQDLSSWRVLGVVSLARTATNTFVDTETPAGTTRYYRARSSPYPGSTVVLKNI